MTDKKIISQYSEYLVSMNNGGRNKKRLDSWEHPLREAVEDIKTGVAKQRTEKIATIEGQEKEITELSYGDILELLRQIAIWGNKQEPHGKYWKRRISLS